MTNTRKIRFLRLVAIGLPLLIGALTWWLSGHIDSRQNSFAGAEVTEVDTARPQTHLSSSFGLPEVELPKDDVFARFEIWAQDYAEQSQMQTVEDGVRLAKERREVLRLLIQKDPQGALARALPWQLRLRMPPEVVALLEERVSAKAEYSVKGARKAPEAGFAVEPVQRAAIIEGRIYDAYVYGRREWVGTKYDLPIEGIAVDRSLAVLERPIRELEADEPLPMGGVKLASQDEHQTTLPPAAPPILVSGGEAFQPCCQAHASAMEQALNEAETSLGPDLGFEVAESAWTEGNKAILVIRVDFSDVTGTPKNTDLTAITPAFATNLINGVTNTFMSEVSYGKTSVNLNTADVTSVLRMPNTAAYYAVNNNADQLRIDSLSAATLAGYNVNNYDRQMVVFSWIGTSQVPNSRFGWAGLGQINGRFTWYNGYFDERVVPHELGHNLSLYHANLWRVSGSDPVDVSNGSSVEYQDPFDCMGNGFYAPINLQHFNPWFLNRIDWLPSSAVLNVTAPGTYRVYRFDDPNVPLNRTLALKITKDSSRNYWLSYRRRFAGVSGGLADVSAGAYVIWGANTNQPSQLIDVDTPGTNPNDASLNVGSSLHDKAAGMIMRVVGSGGTGLDEFLDIRVDQDNRIYALQNVYDVDEAAGSVTLTLVRSGEPNENSTVLVATEDGTAIAPSDYTATSTSVQWLGTDTSAKTVTIPIVSDSTREPAESFRVNITLTNGLSSLVVGSPLTVNIREPGMVDSTFSHNTFPSSGSVRRFVQEPDGQVVFGGRATTVGTTAVNGLGRLSDTGALDVNFNRVTGATPLPVLALARQADGRIIVGGDFTSLRGLALSRVGRLESDGGIDSSFNPGSGANGGVKALAIQADGRILVGGAFTTFDGVQRLGLVRLLPDGSLDESFFNVPISGVTEMDVEAIALLPNGQVMVGGLIRTGEVDQIFEGGFSSGVLRLNEDGSLDESFDIGAGAHLTGDRSAVQRVMALALQTDGKVVVGGAFTAFDGVSALRVARLNTNGSVDTAFQTALGVNGANALVRSLSLQGDGRILVAGHFTALGGTIRTYLGRLLATGAIDTNFDVQLPTFYAGNTPAVCYQAQMLPDARVLLATDATGTGYTTLRRVFSGQSGRSGVIEFVNGSTTVNEGGQTLVEVQRKGGSLGAVSVNYAMIEESADVSDYTDSHGTLTWADGDVSSRYIPVEAIADEVAEETEYFSLQLGVPTGGCFLGERSFSAVAVIDPGAAGFPTVSFATDSSVLEESATTTLKVIVQLSDAVDEVVTVPFILGGTAANAGVGTNGDYRITPTTSLVFGPGQTSKTLTITAVQDNLLEGAEIITLRVANPTGPVLLGNPKLHTVNVVDDDQLPIITNTPMHRFVAVGQPAGPFEGDVQGSLPLTLEWYLNNRIIKGVEGASYSIPEATLKHAGTYVLKAKNKLSEALSAAAELVVVDTSSQTLVLPVGSTVKMGVNAAGNYISYAWMKLGDELSGNPRAVGRQEKSLTISKLELGDSGTYMCRVISPISTKPNGDKFMDGAFYILKVVDTAPEILGLEDGDFLPPAIVSGSYDFQISVNEDDNRAPMKFSASGLPKGLSLDAKTGRISGKPTVTKNTPFDVTLKAANKAGSDSVKVKLLVDAFPEGVAGDYVAVIGGQANLNQNAGGRLDLKITATGAYTGKLLHGGITYSLKGGMDVFLSDSAPPVPLPSGRLHLVAKGKIVPPPLDLFFEINPETGRISHATVSNDFESLSFTGWKQTWDAKKSPADAFDGYHTFALIIPDSIPNVPRGYGFGSVNISTAGVAVFSGKTGDGESVTCSSFISATGEVAFFQALYKTKPGGSLLGVLQLDRSTLVEDDRDNRLTGSLSWIRPETTTKNARVYKDGFGPLDISILGGRYEPQDLILGLPAPGRARVTFTDAGPPSDRNPDASFDIAVKNKVALVGNSLTRTSLKADSKKGGFSGSFTLEDSAGKSVKRAVKYQGIVVPTDEGFSGYGNLLVPQLPTQDPPTTVKTSPILSGRVRLQSVE